MARPTSGIARQRNLLCAPAIPARPSSPARDIKKTAVESELARPFTGRDARKRPFHRQTVSPLAAGMKAPAGNLARRSASKRQDLGTSHRTTRIVIYWPQTVAALDSRVGYEDTTG